MQGRMRKCGGQSSPPAAAMMQQQQMRQERRIPVVYYLCRNRQLEHPHFIEVILSSPEGLFLRDVINRLNVLRGKGMPTLYSWSCKKSYKNVFVWHDLSEDDLILPTNGNEYVLKGSELFEQSPSERIHQFSANSKMQNQKMPQSETPTSSRTQGTSSSSSPSMVFKDSKTPSPPSPPSPMPPPPPRSQRLMEEEQCLSPRKLGTSPNVSPEVYEPSGAADASTQTDDGERKGRSRRNNTCTRGVSTDECSVYFECELSHKNKSIVPKEGSKLSREDLSPLTTSSSSSSFAGKMETLESLIRADTSKMNSFRILEEEEILVPTGPRFKATNMLMQLITCGSITVKDHHSFGLVPTYKPRFSHIKFPSPIFSNSMMFGELDYLSENPRFIGLRMEDKEYFSGSLIETKKHKEDVKEGLPSLKRSSSYNAERSCTSPHSRREKETFLEPPRSKCLPIPVKITSNKQRNGIPCSPISDCPRNSSAGTDCNHSSKSGSKRFNDVSSVKGSSKRFESFNEEDKMIKIEES
ncbi:hypothetical protein AXF42_Ash001768 [Apostasia shenzhenica]|uniref:SOSEKI DIX-like domain-containing protein n=1 Tax=Apostasia shenzhenica TaxID=1088818 RepID=A0A2I0AB58_9ASPA|nr:hypothetical protein AXF42_Ash001768 [Apostasia shenzhenica]